MVVARVKICLGLLLLDGERQHFRNSSAGAIQPALKFASGARLFHRT
jgi:hypothetical protein